MQDLALLESDSVLTKLEVWLSSELYALRIKYMTTCHHAWVKEEIKQRMA